MRQSKYSKKRPIAGTAYSDHQLKKLNSGGNRAIVSEKKIKSERELLSDYDLGVFLDDRRNLNSVNLPKAKQWVVIRSYSEMQNFISEFHSCYDTDSIKNMFISFDHYLDLTDGDRFNGYDCMELCWMFRKSLAAHIDIQGHSADPIKNEQKLQFWYKEAV